MTLDDAFSVLGVEAAATEDEVRRAYLRLVKKHRPESDPTGFQRVREAYDRVRERRLFDFEAVPPVPATTETGVALAQVVDTEGSDPNQTEPDLELFRRLALGLAEQDLEGVVEIWRSAVRRHPDSAEARWELIEAYFQAGKPKRAGRSLLRAYRRGLPGFAAALLARAPGHAPAELCEQAKHDPALAFAAATGLVGMGDPSGALPYLEARLTLEPGDRGGGFMLAHVVIEALSRLGEQGEVVHFERLAQLFSEYLKRNEAALRGPHAAQWLVLRELGATAHALPRFVFRALAESVVRQDAAQLMLRLTRYAEEYPHGAADAREVLKLSAPGLYNAYAPLLQPVAPVGFLPDWRPKTFGWSSILPLLFLAFTGFRICTHSGTSANRASASYSWPRSTGRTAPPPLPAADMYYDRARVDAAVRNLSRLANDRYLTELGLGALAVKEGFSGNCANLAHEIAVLVRLSRDQDASLITEVESLFIEFQHACPMHADEVPKP